MQSYEDELKEQLTFIVCTKVSKRCELDGSDGPNDKKNLQKFKLDNARTGCANIRSFISKLPKRKDVIFEKNVIYILVLK